ncbi:hypothetical protein [Photobacterium sp. GB-72]|uniref:hypothetical protein n=1 Tax=Photobacterium sp. GB-72 TaxID=2022105 RepID=UPI000D173AFC|nr:hypothetical protein [Photobacterium sp. GB-72]PSV27635.1 hypothetical protein C9J40_20075 [Photobacterium sp. GB-72]
MDSDFEKAKINNDEALSVKPEVEDIREDKLEPNNKAKLSKFKLNINKPIPLIGLTVLINLGLTLGVTTLMSKSINSNTASTIESNNQSFMHNMDELESRVNNINKDYQQLSLIISDEADIIEIQNSLTNIKSTVNNHSNMLFEMNRDNNGKKDIAEMDYNTISNLSIRLTTIEEDVKKLEKKLSTHNIVNTKSAKKGKTSPKKVNRKPATKSQLGDYVFLNIDTWGDENVLVVQHNGKIERFRVGHNLKNGNKSWSIKSINTHKAKLVSGSTSMYLGK